MPTAHNTAFTSSQCPPVSPSCQPSKSPAMPSPSHGLKSHSGLQPVRTSPLTLHAPSDSELHMTGTHPLPSPALPASHHRLTYLSALHLYRHTWDRNERPSPVSECIHTCCAHTRAPRLSGPTSSISPDGTPRPPPQAGAHTSPPRQCHSQTYVDPPSTGSQRTQNINTEALPAWVPLPPPRGRKGEEDWGLTEWLPVLAESPLRPLASRAASHGTHSRHTPTQCTQTEPTRPQSLNWGVEGAIQAQVLTHSPTAVSTLPGTLQRHTPAHPQTHTSPLLWTARTFKLAKGTQTNTPPCTGHPTEFRTPTHTCPQACLHREPLPGTGTKAHLPHNPRTHDHACTLCSAPRVCALDPSLTGARSCPTTLRASLCPHPHPDPPPPAAIHPAHRTEPRAREIGFESVSGCGCKF